MGLPSSEFARMFNILLYGSLMFYIAIFVAVIGFTILAVIGIIAIVKYYRNNENKNAEGGC